MGSTTKTNWETQNGIIWEKKKKQRKAQTWVGRDEKVVKGVVVETDELKINFMKFSKN